jgi:TrmH family RNA methyltransferase
MAFQSHLDRLDVVLVSPRNPLNIGAAARAMANFGFSRLAVVAPYEPLWREARSAVGAPELLFNARETSTLAEAVSGSTLVIGTATITRRQPEQPVVQLPNLAPIVRQALTRNGRVALVFGSEKRGLTVEDLAHCHLLVEIPTDPRQPSMNLGQAVAVCLYEIASRAGQPIGNSTQPPDQAPTPDDLRANLRAPTYPPATSSELDRLARIVEETMLAANYSPAAMRKANWHDLHLLLRRLALTRPDSRRILGLFRRILWRLHHRTGQAKN